jgi:hypothetical protein
MNEFVTVSESKTVTAHEIFNNNPVKMAIAGIELVVLCINRISMFISWILILSGIVRQIIVGSSDFEREFNATKRKNKYDTTWTKEM